MVSLSSTQNHDLSESGVVVYPSEFNANLLLAINSQLNLKNTAIYGHVTAINRQLADK